MGWLVLAGAVCAGVLITRRHYRFRSYGFKVGMTGGITCLAYIVAYVFILLGSSLTFSSSAEARETASKVFGLESGKQYPIALSEDEAPAEGFFIEVNHTKNGRGDLLITFRHPQKQDQTLEIPEREIAWSQHNQSPHVTLDLGDELLDSGKWVPIASNCSLQRNGPFYVCHRKIRYDFQADPFPDLNIVVQKGFTTSVFAGNSPQVRINVTAKQYAAIHGQPGQ